MLHQCKMDWSINEFSWDNSSEMYLMYCNLNSKALNVIEIWKKKMTAILLTIIHDKKLWHYKMQNNNHDPQIVFLFSIF